MKTNSILILIVVVLGIISCGGPEKKSETSKQIEKDTTVKGNVTYIELSDQLNDLQIKEGMSIFEQRCDNCHMLDSTTLVGPGWAGITNRRSPEWIMNMILNVSLMIENDSVAHNLMSKNAVKMPDQNLSVDKARSILEFMRLNDLDKLGKKDEGDKKNQ